MEERGRQIFSKTVRASKLTRQRTLQINNAHLDGSRCWQHLQEATKKTFSFIVSWQKQMKLYVSSQDWVVISTFSFKPLMLKLTKIDTKRLKLSFAIFEDTEKTELLCIHCLRLGVHAWVNRFLMVSFLNLLSSLRVNILKQLFFSASVNIVEKSPRHSSTLLFIQSISPILIG